jgi:8-oxo-dGTP pyrophosphatase MutT (NUDIX family)
VGGGITLATISRALARPQPEILRPPTPGRRAAVAAVLRERDAAVELLFIHRAEHPRDPWSGQMAWPGGRIDPADAGPLAAAIRETREEVGLDLEHAGELLGRLSEVRTHLRRGPGPLSVVPFVFHVHDDPPLDPNREVQAALWIPLDFFADRRRRGRFVWTGRGVPLVMPCYRYDGQLIWGLTLRMVDELAQLGASEGG